MKDCLENLKRNVETLEKVLRMEILLDTMEQDLAEKEVIEE